MRKTLIILFCMLGISVCAQTVTGSSANSVGDGAGMLSNLTPEIQDKINYIRGVNEKVKELKNYTEYLDIEGTQRLPVSITRWMGGQSYDILVDKVELTPRGAEISASFMFEIPKTGELIYFNAEHIPIHEGGLANDVRLNLIYAPAIPLSDKMSLQLVGDNGGTFVTFGCDGYKGMGISAIINFSTELLVADPGDGSKGSEPVSASFSTAFEQWGEFTAEINFSSAFQVSTLKGMGFTVYNSVIDLSDLATPTSVTFPDNYQVNDRLLWQGIFIREFDVSMPKQFNKSTSGERLKVSGYNILIDALGLTGGFVTRGNILPSGEGNMNGWDFSIDSLGVNFLASNINGAGFRGTMDIPLKKSGGTSQALSYQADIYSGDEYLFDVRLGSSLELNFVKANILLSQGSGMIVELDNDRFMPALILNGNITINESKLSINKVDFEEMKFETQAPYFSVKAFDLKANKEHEPQKLKNFPVVFDSVFVYTEGPFTGIGFGAHIALDSDGGNSISAVTQFAVLGKIDVQPKMILAFERIDIAAIALEAETGAFSIRGTLNSFNDNSLYGQGFKGMVAVTVADVIAVDATIQFGSVSNFRYWYFDGALATKNGINVTTGISIYGFGGGAYRHMRREITGGETRLPDPSSETRRLDQSLEPGVTLSGARYIPDATQALGLKASVILGTTGSATACNGEVGLEVAFTTSGGIYSFGMNGRLQFATPVEERYSDNAPVRALVNITFFVPEKILSAGADVTFNVAGGLTGGGRMSMYASPSKWYFYLGQPNPPDRLTLDLKGICDISAYMMIGNEIPAMPDLPLKIRQALNIESQRNTTDLAKANGFAFGAALEFGTGREEFLCFFGSFNILGGLDVMLRSTAKEQVCENTHERPGINGYFANGQVYAYVQGSIGIKSEKFGDVEILEISAAAALQVKAPKPTWIKGIVGGTYSILDGLIKGTCRFEIEKGVKCNLSGGNLLGDIKIISSVTPSNGETVNVFTAPRAALNIAEGKTYTVTDNNGNNRVFSVRIEYMKILDGTTELKGIQKWNTGRDIVSFICHETLPPQKTLTLKVKAYFVEYKNGTYTPYKVNDRTVEEEHVVNFKTGDAPAYVPTSNIVYSYPMEGQYNFYRNEYGQGYVQLLMGQKYLFGDQVDQTKWTQAAKLVSGSTSEVVSFSYNESEKRIEFPIPSTIQNSKVYTFSIVNSPKASDSQQSGRDSSVITSNEGQVNVRLNNLNGNELREGEIEVFGLHFRSSRYNSFTEKMQSLSLTNPTNWALAGGVSQVSMELKGPEFMDAFELNGNNNDNIKPLIQIQSEQTHPWYSSTIKPLIYNNYPLDGALRIQTRDTTVLGLVPVRAVYIAQTNPTKIISAADVQSGNSGPVGGKSTVVYDVSWYASEDFGDLKEQSAARITYVPNPGQQLRNLVNANYPNISQGRYVVRAAYVLPGTGQVTSTFPLTLVNP